MKNAHKLWIIAIVVLIGFVAIALFLAGCGGGTTTLKELSGTITITPNTDVITGTTLTAIYSGTETVSFQWRRDTSNVGTGDTYTPDQAGSYTVTVSAAGFNSKTSAAISVTAGPAPTYTVSFNSNGGTAVSPITGLSSGATISAPTTPTKTGYESKFSGWFKEAGLTNEWVFASDTVTANITLYAKWEAYALGDTGPGGGIIFHVVPAGFTVEGTSAGTGVWPQSYTAHYLEAAPENHGSTVTWGAHFTQIQNGLSTFTETEDPLFNKIGNGRKDTRIIVDNLGISGNNRAAPVAAVSTFGNQDDWFLPSSGELNLLNLQKSLTGINITDVVLWSSSQGDEVNAWYHNFHQYNQRGYSAKNIERIVRAIRAF